MRKNIAIIGGGISGLSVLHYLKKKFSSSHQIQLLESDSLPGGKAHSKKQDGLLFETGPNGFLASRPRTLSLIDDLGLNEKLISANQESKVRYISFDSKLHKLPTGPSGLFTFSLLSAGEKVRIFKEPFIAKGNRAEESVHDFAQRRFGARVADLIIDPMMSGIYGGNARLSNYKSVFPKLYAMEEQHGSIIKGFMRGRKKNKSGQKGLRSFEGGIGQLIKSLHEQYKDNIIAGQKVDNITYENNQYTLSTAAGEKFNADHVFMCAPAYAAAQIVCRFNPTLSEALNSIHYAPIAVVGLAYKKKDLPSNPNGYGYLIPSCENNMVMGVLFEDKIFHGRAPEDKVLFRVMIGGARHPEICGFTQNQLVDIARKEIQRVLGGPLNDPQDVFFKLWSKAIPQYDNVYCAAKQVIENEIKRTPKFQIVANYINGVSLNDCIENAYNTVEQMN